MSDFEDKWGVDGLASVGQTYTLIPTEPKPEDTFLTFYAQIDGVHAKLLSIRYDGEITGKMPEPYLSAFEACMRQTFMAVAERISTAPA